MTSWFSKNKITHNFDIIAQDLREARVSKGISIGDAAQKSNINLKYVKAMEEGRMYELPEGLYGKNFLREYALFLGRDAQPLLDLYHAEKSHGSQNDKGDVFARKTAQVNYAINIPKILRNTAISLVIIISLAYLGYSLRAIISPPPLNIIAPVDNLTTKESTININGQTIAEASVEINGEKVLTDANGAFEKEINLKTGLNSIIIKAKKDYSRSHEIIKNVLLEE